LLPEHLRLGTWELLCGWSQAPRLALQVIHEAALCHCNPRCGRTLSQKGFELANGLPFVASDRAVHELLAARTVAASQSLQVALAIQPYQSWDAVHLARSLLGGLEGDVRVHEDTIRVTYYNAPNATLLRDHYQGLPEKLRAQNIDPRIPWLYNFKLDFRFK